MSSPAQTLLVQQLQNHLSTFSIGSFGAIAEFQRSQSESTNTHVKESLSLITKLGALKLELLDNVQAIAYENLSKQHRHWRNSIVFCLPGHSGKSKQRSVLTELGPDWSAVRSQDRSAMLFDIGLNAKNIDFCIRTEDKKLLEILRRVEGRSVLEPNNRVMAEIIAASPHRVATSKLGRIEVYQRIPIDRTPEGPHTHVLPKLLLTGRTHSANVPVPVDYLPCLSCYPANPMYDSLGNETSFDTKIFQDFIGILDRWGLPDYLKEKKRVLEAIQKSVAPTDFVQPSTRLGRTALRVTLRQLICQNQSSSLLKKWQHSFDSVDNIGVD